MYTRPRVRYGRKTNGCVNFWWCFGKMYGKFYAVFFLQNSVLWWGIFCNLLTTWVFWDGFGKSVLLFQDKHASFKSIFVCLNPGCVKSTCLVYHKPPLFQVSPSALHSTALHSIALHCTALHCTALHCTSPHRTAPHCTALHCTAVYQCISACSWLPLLPHLAILEMNHYLNILKRVTRNMFFSIIVYDS